MTSTYHLQYVDRCCACVDAHGGHPILTWTQCNTRVPLFLVRCTFVLLVILGITHLCIFVLLVILGITHFVIS